MKKIFSFLGKRKKIENNNSKIESLGIQDISPKTVILSDDFAVSVVGMPRELTAMEQKQIYLSLLRNGLNLSEERVYQKGDKVFRGKAILNTKNKAFQIEYSISALRVLQALSVYKEAYDRVIRGAEKGEFDPQLAEEAADYLKEAAKQELFGYSSVKQEIITDVKSIEMNVSPINQDPNK